MKKLISETETIVRFSDVDSLKIIWHGNYVKYLEDGREAFGEKYGLDYFKMSDEGFVAPMVNINIDYKMIVKYGDKLLIETEYVDTPAAKLIFKYKIYRRSDNKLAAVGTTTQVFLDMSGNLQLINPDFYLDWKNKYK